ncbi:MAG TPA: amino acid ABC transporter permease [Propylenella sp.]|nr:amino acid ABC transporter permease [Propylenella sp.]
MDRFLHEVWVARWAILEGLLTTIEVSAISIVAGSALGLLIGVALTYGPKWLRWPCLLYVDFIRGTPVLVLVLAAFYILAVIGIHFSAIQAGVFALSLFCAAHVGEVVRGALQAIPQGQIEAARSIGLKFPHILGLVLLPQALRQVVPVWINVGAELVKASTLLSIIGVGELLLKTQQIVGRNFMTLEFYLLAGALYFAVNFCIERVGKRAERRFALR